MAQLFTARVQDIVTLNDPLTGWEWDCKPVGRDLIAQAVAENRRDARPWQTVNAKMPKRDWVRFHAERVAYLVTVPDAAPVELEVEPFDENGPGWPMVINGYRLRITDGIHRIAAAHYRGDETIRFTLSYGSKDELLSILPSAAMVA